jgi:hypothetical protein
MVQARRRIKKKPETWGEADLRKGEEKDLVEIRTAVAGDNSFFSKALIACGTRARNRLASHGPRI